MAYHPLNLAVRFVLELVMLFSAGEWGWKLFENKFSWPFAILFPVILATIWGIFNVKDDKSRSGKTVVEVPGLVRFVLELLLFGMAGWFLYQSGHTYLSRIFLGIVIAHYIVSYDRIKWLLKK